jgi:hypothetical protein
VRILRLDLMDGVLDLVDLGGRSRKECRMDAGRAADPSGTIGRPQGGASQIPR